VVQALVVELQHAPVQGLGEQETADHTPLQAPCVVTVQALVVVLQQAPVWAEAGLAERKRAAARAATCGIKAWNVERRVGQSGTEHSKVFMGLTLMNELYAEAGGLLPRTPRIGADRPDFEVFARFRRRMSARTCLTNSGGTPSQSARGRRRGL